MPQKVDLAGKRFGKLIALESTGDRDNHKNVLWLCKCDCGKTIHARAASLQSGNTHSCGCFKGLDLTGQHFNRLTVIKPIGIKDRSRMWLCKCDCGKDFTALAYTLINGSRQSCGCLWKEHLHMKALPNKRASVNLVIRDYKNHAKARGNKYELSDDDFIKITQSPCFYCGAHPSNSTHNRRGSGNYIYNGIDRIDNSNGYSLNNIVSCCRTCNLAKRDMSQQDFFQWIKRVYKHSVKLKASIAFLV